MARPVVKDVTEDLYSRLGPWQRADTIRGTEDDKWHLLEMSEAAIQGLQPVEDVVRDTDDGPGWSAVMDVDRCPREWLPWMAQLAGVRIPPGLTEAEERDWVRRADGMRRGTPTAVKEAAAKVLRGTKSVLLVERHGSAYRFTVTTLADETPYIDNPTSWGTPINGIANPALRTNSSGWSKSHGAGTTNYSGRRADTLSPTGYALESDVTFSGDPSSPQQYINGPPYSAPAAPGDLILARSRSRLVTAVAGDVWEAGVLVRFYNSGGGLISQNAADFHNITTDDGYLESVVSLVAPANTASVGVGTRWVGPATAGRRVFRTTAAQVIANPPAADPGYFDGASIGYRWTGTADASTSESPRSGTSSYVYNALLGQKPMGLILTAAVISGTDYNTVRDTHADYADILSTYTSYAEIAADPDK